MAGMSKTQFAKIVTADVLERGARKCFAGHGIKAAVIQELANRPDVIARLAVALSVTKMANKGASGFKKTANFSILSYKNFGDFANTGAEDLESFISTLSPEDQASFSNDTNAVVIFFTKNKSNGFVPGEEGDDVVEEIVTGASETLPFEKAVTIKNSIGNGMYLVVAFGNSAVRPSDEKIAMTSRAKINKADKERKNAATIKNKLKRRVAKARADVRANKNAYEQLLNSQRQLNAQMQQRALLNDLAGDMETYQAQNAQFVKRLNNADRAILGKARKMEAAGNTEKAKMLINTMDNPTMGMRVLYGTDAPIGMQMAVDKRYKELSKKERVLKNSIELLRERYTAVEATGDTKKMRSIKSMISTKSSELKRVSAMKNRYKNSTFESNDALAEKLKALLDKKAQLEIDLALAPLEAPQKVNSVRSMLSKVNSEIKRLNDRVNANNLTPQQRMQNLRAEMDANIAAGATMKQALNAALSQLEATAQQKAQIRQQVAEMVAQGVPGQFAAMQAQQNVMGSSQQELFNDDEEDDAVLDGTSVVEDLLSQL